MRFYSVAEAITSFILNITLLPMSFAVTDEDVSTIYTMLNNDRHVDAIKYLREITCMNDVLQDERNINSVCTDFVEWLANSDVTFVTKHAPALSLREAKSVIDWMRVNRSLYN